MFKPKRWTDDELADENDGSASAAAFPQEGTGGFVHVDASAYNALICEVQAWRHANPGVEFVSGPNVLREYAKK